MACVCANWAIFHGGVASSAPWSLLIDCLFEAPLKISLVHTLLDLPSPASPPPFGDGLTFQREVTHGGRRYVQSTRINIANSIKSISVSVRMGSLF